MQNTVVKDLVSVIIPVYNRENLIKKSINSVLAQTYRPIEIIVVNDGSTDNTGEVCDDYSKNHPEVMVIHQKNQGVAMARESARKILKGEFVQHLDSDDLLAPQRFEKLVSALKAHPECDIAYSRIQLIDEHGTVIDNALKDTGKYHKTLFPALLNERWWVTPSPLFRRSVIDSAGAWLNLKTCEDWEYDARIGRNNPKLYWTDEALAIVSRRHDSEHLSQHWLDGASRYLWATSMIDHARSAGMADFDPEMITFSKYLRLLARQYWQKDDSTWAKRLYSLSLSLGRPNLFERVYFTMASIFGKPLVTLSEWVYRIKP